MNQKELAAHIANLLNSNFSMLKSYWDESSPVKHFYIDSIVPDDLVEQAADGFPKIENMNRRESIREKKYTSAKMANWGNTTQMIFLALQSNEVMEVIARITDIDNLVGDPNGYAGGISAMSQGDFLNPHLDNSTHPHITGYRRLNALYYVTPNWEKDFGGNLELWSEDLEERIEIASKFNRLVVMNTNNKSLHSVNKVTGNGVRKCISNYYFNNQSPSGKDYHHITSFRGRPEEPFKDLYLRIEGFLGSKLQAIAGKPLKKGEQ